MAGNHAINAKALANRVSPPDVARLQRWTVGVVGLLLLMTCWGAWVFLIGFRPCALVSLFWR